MLVGQSLKQAGSFLFSLFNSSLGLHSQGDVLLVHTQAHILVGQSLEQAGSLREAEKHYTDAKDWKAAVQMYRGAVRACSSFFSTLTAISQLGMQSTH